MSLSAQRPLLLRACISLMKYEKPTTHKDGQILRARLAAVDHVAEAPASEVGTPAKSVPDHDQVTSQGVPAG